MGPCSSPLDSAAGGGQDSSDSLRGELGERTSVANDANLAALGELHGGWGATFDSFVYLMVGTGLGMGIVVNGRLEVGRRGAAGEVAYLPFGDEATSRPSVSGTRWGSFEERVSARGVVEAAVELGMSPGSQPGRSSTRPAAAWRRPGPRSSARRSASPSSSPPSPPCSTPRRW